MKHEHILTQVIERAAKSGADALASPFTVGASQNWFNELGSVASFTYNTGGVLTGSYTSKVSTGGGTITGPLTGWYSGYVISWIVMWPTNPPTMTAWVGDYINVPGGGYNIETMWYLVSQTATPGDPTQFWTAVNAGSDLFLPQ